MLRWTRVLPTLALLLWMVAATAAHAQEPTLSDHLHALANEAAEGIEAADRGDRPAMRHAYDESHELWESFEDDMRSADPSAYTEIEAALGQVREELGESAEPGLVGQAFDRLEDAAEQAQANLASGSSSAQAASSVTIAGVLDDIGAADAAVARSDAAAAQGLLERALRGWPVVEGAVAASSAQDYSAIEHDLGVASAALRANPARLAEAHDALDRVRMRLAPYTQSQQYNAFDAAAIVLREGLEALLVIVALLAFLQRSGNAAQRIWIWVGGLAGIVASIITAFVLQIVFSQVMAGQNRELMEGVTSLVAAGLLFYVSYWLHSKANLQSWKRYIDERTTRSIASGSVLGLAALAFLAVFREGAETVVFYLGMAPSITAADLWLGLLAGVAILVGAAILMLVVGVRLPLRQFFQVAGLLVYYLGFKFVGAGIHSLQVANLLPSNPVEVVPVVPFFGIYPTWQTLVPQLLLIVAAIAALLYFRSQDRRTATLAG
jgi:high-affinity iron transporter